MLLPLLLSLAPQAGLTAETFPPDGTSLERPGLPGTICVFGEQASAVLTSGGRQVQAVAAVASAGEGRIFAIAHNGYLAPRFFTEEDGWMRRGLKWLRDEQQPGVVMFLDGDGGALAATLRGLGYSIQPFSEAGLSTAQLLIVEGGNPIPAPRLAAIDAWLQEGGTVLAAICPWGWQQIHAGRGWKLSTDMAANQVLGPHGLLFTDGFADASRDGNFQMDRSANASVRCQTLVDRMSGGMIPKNLAPLEAALRVLPPDDTQLLPRLLPLLPELEGNLLPTPSSPLSVKKHPVARLAVVARDRQLAETWPEDPYESIIAPGAEEFPGRVPEGSSTVSWQVECDAQQEGWQSTGLYVDAGSTVLLGFTGESTGWTYRIGAHEDLIWHKDRWPRWPSVSRSGNLEHRITSPFGGLLYVQADTSKAEDLGLIVMGAYETPWWRDGVTTDREWERIRKAPGPWAELQGKYLILTVPSASVRELEDPAALMAWWDKVVEEQVALAGEDPPARPERFVSDVL
ncbi:MAG: M60 family metallopeptidase, partial [Planctomycetota bacterium]